PELTDYYSYHLPYNQVFDLSRDFAAKGYSTIGAELIRGIIDNTMAMRDASSSRRVWEELRNSGVVPRLPSKPLPSRIWDRFARSRLWKQFTVRTRSRLPSYSSGETSRSVNETSSTTERRVTPGRHLNAWIDNETPTVGDPFHVSVNIGSPKEIASASVPFVE